jgi:hypothetical protein
LIALPLAVLADLRREGLYSSTLNDGAGFVTLGALGAMTSVMPFRMSL